MRLALLEFCLIGLIESARSVRPTNSNVGDHSDQQSDGSQQFNERMHSSSTYSPSAYSPNYFTHHKSPHLQRNLERVKRQETKETDPTTRLTTQTTTKTTTKPIVPTKSTDMTTTEGTTKEITSTEGSDTEDLPLATTAGPRSTSLFLHFIWTFTVLFMIGSMGALYYLKKYSEKLNPKKDSADDQDREDSGSTKDRMKSRTETQTENPEVGSNLLGSNLESRPNSGFSTDPKITLHHKSNYIEEIKNKLRNFVNM